MVNFLNYYTVTLSPPGTNVAPADGFVDNTRVETYLASTYPAGFSYADSMAKRRANMRFKSITQQIGLMTNIAMIKIMAPGATSQSGPSSFSMVCQIERGDPALVTIDELHPGITLFGAAALTRTVARGIMLTFSDNLDVYDPTLVAARGNPNLANRIGVRVMPFVVSPYVADLATAESTITTSPYIF